MNIILFPETSALPTAGGITDTIEAIRESPSTSEVGVITVMEIGVSSLVDVVMVAAFGASLTAATVTVTVAVSNPPKPSDTVIVNESRPW